MKLNRNSVINEKEAWEKAGVVLPDFDIEKMISLTKDSPIWVHFGAGNIFKGYVANMQNKLLNMGLADKGIIAVDSSNGDQLVKVYNPFDNLTLLVSLHADGSSDKEVVASIAEAIHADWSKDDQIARLKEIFRSPSLQICSFTITEKGYSVRDIDAEELTCPKCVMGKVAALLYERYAAGKYPMAVLSLDNCSHNGEKLRDSVLSIAKSWLDKGEADQGFIDYISDESVVSFPWSMIDKITPRPNEDISKQLLDLGIEDMVVIPREKAAPCAPFVNCESSEYLVIEDNFPNGRPPLEKSGIYMTDRDTVNKTERMKVTTCLNPLHTAMSVCGCMLGYNRIFKEMEDEDIKGLVTRIGKVEGMPVVTNPGIIDPNDFLEDVLVNRLPNPYIPDMPQRIACDTSHKVPVRFGETIKSYLASDTLDISSLECIPFAIAAWLRYLHATDDNGEAFELPEDPRIEELQLKLKDGIDDILTDSTLFGADLTKTPLYEKIKYYYEKMLSGKGAVREALHEAVNK